MPPKIRSVLFVSFLAAAGLVFSACHWHYHKGPEHAHRKPSPAGGTSSSVEKYCLRRGYEPGTLDFKNCVHKRNARLREKKRIYREEQIKQKPKHYPEKQKPAGTVKPAPKPVYKPAPTTEKKPPQPLKKQPPPATKKKYPQTEGQVPATLNRTK